MINLNENSKINFFIQTNGVVRNGEGKLIGFFDKESQTLDVDGEIKVFRAIDEDAVADIFEWINNNKNAA